MANPRTNSTAVCAGVAAIAHGRNQRSDREACHTDQRGMHASAAEGRLMRPSQQEFINAPPSLREDSLPESPHACMGMGSATLGSPVLR